MIENIDQLNAALAAPGEFKRLITSATDLVVVGREFPNYTYQLIRPLLNDPGEFKRLIASSTDLIIVAREFSSHKVELMHQLLNNAEEFKRLITSATDLTVVGREFPKYKNLLIQRLLNDPEEFKKLVKSTADLIMVGREFPGHGVIFNQPSVEESLEALKNMITASSYTQGAVAGTLSRGDKSKIIPDAVARYTSVFLNRKDGGNSAQTSKTAAKDANDTQNIEIMNIKSRKK